MQKYLISNPTRQQVALVCIEFNTEEIFKLEKIHIEARDKKWFNHRDYLIEYLEVNQKILNQN